MPNGDDVICIDHNRETKCFSFEIKKWSYSYQYIVIINDVKVIYEPDEEGNLRARTVEPSTTSADFRDMVRLVGEQVKARLDIW